MVLAVVVQQSGFQSFDGSDRNDGILLSVQRRGVPSMHEAEVPRDARDVFYHQVR